MVRGSHPALRLENHCAYASCGSGVAYWAAPMLSLSVQEPWLTNALLAKHGTWFTSCHWKLAAFRLSYSIPGEQLV
jgi:hypothetical protein